MNSEAREKYHPGGKNNSLEREGEIRDEKKVSPFVRVRACVLVFAEKRCESAFTLEQPFQVARKKTEENYRRNTTSEKS